MYIYEEHWMQTRIDGRHGSYLKTSESCAQYTYISRYWFLAFALDSRKKESRLLDIIINNVRVELVFWIWIIYIYVYVQLSKVLDHAKFCFLFCLGTYLFSQLWKKYVQIHLLIMMKYKNRTNKHSRTNKQTKKEEKDKRTDQGGG